MSITQKNVGQIITPAPFTINLAFNLIPLGLNNDRNQFENYQPKTHLSLYTCLNDVLEQRESPISDNTFLLFISIHKRTAMDVHIDK